MSGSMSTWVPQFGHSVPGGTAQKTTDSPGAGRFATRQLLRIGGCGGFRSAVFSVRFSGWEFGVMKFTGEACDRCDGPLK